MNIEEKIIEIAEKYWHKDEAYYSEFRYDSQENEFWLQAEIKDFLESVKVPYSIGYEDGYDSCGYSNDFLAVAWFNNGEVNLVTFLLECM